MSRIARKLSYANVVATAALLLALGGTAWALVVTSSMIANGTIVSADLHDGGVLGRDIRNRTIGLADLSAVAVRSLKQQSMTGTIPSGTTVRGAWGISGRAAAGIGIDTVVSLPAAAPVVLTDATVQGQATGGVAGDADATCTGTFESPTAPAGKACIYISNTTGGGGVAAIYGKSGVDRYGFIVNVLPSVGGTDIMGVGSWAYRAP